MRYLFCNCSKYKCAEDAYESRRASAELLRSWERAMDEEYDLSKRYHLPRTLYTIQLICLFIAIATLGKVIISLVDHRSLSSFWIMLILGGVSLSIFLCVVFLDKYLIKKRKRNEGVKRAEAKVKNAEKRIKDFMDVPEDMEQIDVLHFSYKEEKGKLKITGSSFVYKYFFYNSNRDLIIFNGFDYQYAIPHNEIKSVKLINKRIEPLIWLEPLSKDKKRFFLGSTTLEKGIKFFCVLVLLHKGETMYLPFPDYELPAMLELTGLEPRDPEVKALLDRSNSCNY